MPRPFNYDRFTGVDPRLSGQCAIAVLNALQNFPPEVQASGLSVAFASVLDLYDLHPGTAMQVARNLLARERQAVGELKAVELYAQNEL